LTAKNNYINSQISGDMKESSNTVNFEISSTIRNEFCNH